MATLGLQAAHAQQIGLDSAIRASAENLSGNIRSGSSVAVLAMESSSDRMSDYLINETIVAMIGMQDGRSFTMVTRTQLDHLLGELDFNMSGYVSDETAQRIGHFIGAQYVVIGAFEPLAGFFRFRAQLIGVETAVIHAMHTADVQMDSLVAALLAEADVDTTMAMVQLSFNHFSGFERFGTAALNFAVPGLGSFLIMNDTFGGVLQSIIGIPGLTLMIMSMTDMSPVYQSGEIDWGIMMFLGGFFLYAISSYVNQVRARTFMRSAPTPRAASLPEQWNIAVSPASEGGLGNVTFTHTLRF